MLGNIIILSVVVICFSQNVMADHLSSSVYEFSRSVIGFDEQAVRPHYYGYWQPKNWSDSDAKNLYFCGGKVDGEVRNPSSGRKEIDQPITFGGWGCGQETAKEAGIDGCLVYSAPTKWKGFGGQQHVTVGTGNCQNLRGQLECKKFGNCYPEKVTDGESKPGRSVISEHRKFVSLAGARRDLGDAISMCRREGGHVIDSEFMSRELLTELGINYTKDRVFNRRQNNDGIFYYELKGYPPAGIPDPILDDPSAPESNTSGEVARKYYRGFVVCQLNATSSDTTQFKPDSTTAHSTIEQSPIGEKIQNLFATNKIMANCEFFVEKDNAPVSLKIVTNKSPELAIEQGCSSCEEGHRCRVTSCFAMVNQKRIELTVDPKQIPQACRDTNGEARFRLTLLKTLAAKEQPDAFREFQSTYGSEVGAEHPQAADPATLARIEDALARIEKLRLEQLKQQQRLAPQPQRVTSTPPSSENVHEDEKEWRTFIAEFKKRVDRELQENPPHKPSHGQHVEFGEYVRGIGGGLALTTTNRYGGPPTIVQYRGQAETIPLHLRAIAAKLGGLTN